MFIEKQSQKRLEKAEKWSKIRKQLQIENGRNIGKRGGISGILEEEIILKKNRKYDYRRFLQRFTFPGEEMMLDLESFDYIPYTYSRDYYKKLVLLEPLEYTEVHKLKEFIIAIDTSGSCRGDIVRQFLEETYTILNRKENFFSKNASAFNSMRLRFSLAYCKGNQKRTEEEIQEVLYEQNIEKKETWDKLQDYREVLVWMRIDDRERKVEKLLDSK